MTSRLLFATAAARDATAKMGAIDGGNQTLARLEQHLATWRPRADRVA